MSNASRIEKEEGQIVVSELRVSPFQKEGTKTAMLRQDIKTISYYPKKKANNSLTDSVFGEEEFGFSESDFSSTEHRVCFINVPGDMTLEQVQARINTAKGARLYRILSNHPITSESQEAAIRNGLRTLNQFANKQVVRYGVNMPNAGELITWNGKPQYRGTYFSQSGKADLDLRTDDPDDYYVTPEIRAELTGVLIEADAAQPSVEAVLKQDEVGQTV